MSDFKFFPGKNFLHEYPEQRDRQKSARKLNVSMVDSENMRGIINDYEVTPDSCTCRDFQMRDLPCKHMYRLAHELGLFRVSGKVVNDPNITGSLTIARNKMVLKTDVYNLNEDDRYLFYLVIYYYLYEHQSAYVTPRTTNIETLISRGMVKEVLDLNSFTDQVNKKELVSFLKEHPCKIRLNAKKQVMIESLLNSYPELLAVFLLRYWILQPTESYIPHLNSIYRLVIPKDTAKRVNYRDYL